VTPVGVTGHGHVVGRCEATPYLKVRKNRKFMGLQDELAVVAAARAIESAGLSGRPLGERVGLYMVVGYIPFEEGDIATLLEGSLEEGRFSVARFATGGFAAINPLLTFRCLPNMPAYHVSANFDLQGPYFVTYPGPGQFYAALEQACVDLSEGRVDAALVGGVAHQRNFLVEHHFSRVHPPAKADSLRDAAGFLVLEPVARARDRQRGALIEFETSYVQPTDAFAAGGTASEYLRGCSESIVGLGPASLPVGLALSHGAREHVLRTDGIHAYSKWESR